MTFDPIIFGKEQSTRIVSAEVQDGYVELFRQKEDGSVESLFLENAYWILSIYRLGDEWERLKGDLAYKYIKFYSTKEEFDTARKSMWKLKKDREIFYIINAVEAAQCLLGFTYFKDMKPNEPTILAFDIESTGLKHNEDSKVLLIANTLRKNGVITRKLFAYDEYDTEAGMFDAWCSWVREVDPSVLCGHNIFSYDLPYMRYCADKAGTSLLLGRDGSELQIEDYERKFRVDGNRELPYKMTRAYGREFIDTMFLSIRKDVERKYSSYALKKIIEEEGWEIQGRQFYDAGKIKDNYKTPIEWTKIKKYAEFDSDDSLKLYDQFIAPYFFMVQSVAKNWQNFNTSASGSQLNSIMIRAYLQEGHSLPQADETENFEGAISMGVAGHYKNACRFDFISQYPSIMREYKIYPRNKDPKGYIPQIIDYVFTERIKNKKLANETGDSYYRHLEQSQKILANSLYGFYGSAGLLFNYPAGGALVTKKGRELLKQAIKWASGKDTVWNDEKDKWELI